MTATPAHHPIEQARVSTVGMNIPLEGSALTSADLTTRRVLVLAYFYPPDASGGVPRTVKFGKYLARLNWRCSIIAPRWGNASFGAELAAESTAVANPRVFRAGRGGDSGLWRRLHQVPLFWRIADRARDALQFPDRSSVWRREALPIARRVLAGDDHAVVYSTSPPVTSHYIALRLKREFGIPWVADFRDPWTDNRIDYDNPPGWRRSRDLHLEHAIYREADYVIANTESNRRALIERHGVSPDKVVTITNGFDDEDFRGVTGAPPTDRFRITYSGSFYSTYNPSAFLAALRQFLARRGDARVEFTLAGSACKWAKDNIHDAEIAGRIHYLGQIPSYDVFPLLMSSHLLLHTYPSGIPYSVPGKLYEYLRSGRPIVAVCDRPSEVASLLERTARGAAFRPDETAELAAFLENAYTRWELAPAAYPAIPPDERIQPYERSLLTQRLAEIFGRVTRH